MSPHGDIVSFYIALHCKNWQEDAITLLIKAFKKLKSNKRKKESFVYKKYCNTTVQQRQQNVSSLNTCELHGKTKCA